MMILWQSPDPRVLFLFVLCLVVSEMFVQLRWRLTVACPYCGFNPLIYLKSPEMAAQRVKEFFESKKENSGFYLTQNPLLKVALRQARARNANAKSFRIKNDLQLPKQKDSGQNLSKTI